MTCVRKHENQGAVNAGSGQFGQGKDLDDAVLAATNNMINDMDGPKNYVELSVECTNLPNLDTFTRTDAMVLLYQKVG